MRWKIRCPYQVAQVQSIENKRGKPLGSFPSLSAELHRILINKYFMRLFVY